MTPSIWQQRFTQAAFIGMAVFYIILGVSYASQTPDWQVPDEPAHYNYIRQLAEEAYLPVMEQGDWDSAYQNQLVSSRFDPQYLADLDRVQFQDHQPPLYYFLATPVYWLSDGDLLAIRLLSVAFGLGIYGCTVIIVRRLFPQQPALALATGGFVVFIPQHLAFLGGANNDPLAMLVVAANLFGVVWYLDQEEIPRLKDGVLLGVLVGIALLTKSTIYFLAGIVGLAILLRWRRQAWTMSVGIRQVLAFLIPALMLGGMWWGRNLDVYGGTDFLGLQRHNEVAADQLQREEYIVLLDNDIGQYRQNLVYTTFHSFWGQFGWMAVPMPTRVYQVLLGMGIIALLGIPLYGWQSRLSAVQQESLALFTLTMGFVLAAYLFYNLTFVQFQGRYLYPALVPLGLWLMLGLTGWVAPLTQHFPKLTWLRWYPLFVVMVLGLFACYALQTYVVPNL